MDESDLYLLIKETGEKYQEQFETQHETSIQTISLEKTARILNIPHEHPILAMLFDAADIDDNNALDKHEFVKICAAFELLKQGDAKLVPGAIFVLADVNGDFSVDIEEVKKIAKIFRMFPNESERLLAKLKEVGGQMNFEQFTAAIL